VLHAFSEVDLTAVKDEDDLLLLFVLRWLPVRDEMRSR